ncbi:20 kDa calcium-binding protein [Clonorchis sinensis]|uniref:20 kDa calcium-binding protein n=1 Tax=Clonorchis sinensis TaxID=79923 RepID=A0A8T1MGR0_CLOSI|nr:20 kDa calcium-binding protein [Clonorchis sinensis]
MYRTQSFGYIDQNHSANFDTSINRSQSHQYVFDRSYEFPSLTNHTTPLRKPREWSLPPVKWEKFYQQENPVNNRFLSSSRTVGFYQIPISRFKRSTSQNSVCETGYGSRNRHDRYIEQTRWNFPKSIQVCALSQSAPSIIACIDQPGIFSDPKSHTCRHDGADWEDCRIHIQCFGLGERKRLHLTGKNGCTATRKKRKNIPPAYTQQPTGIYTSTVPGTHSHPRRLIGKDRTQRQDTPEPVYARSVRLSIVPLNPIYRRKHHAQSVNPACTGIKWQVIQYPTSKRPRYYTWCKRLIQKMAFKIDDFTIQEDQVKNAKEIFKKYDKRGQDKISTTDLGPAFRALNLKVKPDTLKEWADQVDDDATGFIDFNGFLICYGKSLQEEQDERDLRDAFRVLDKNKKGEIDVEDLRWILKELGDDLTEEEIDDMIRDTDTDGSGFVDFDEFYKLMTSE